MSGQIILVGATSGQATFTVDATTTKVTLDTPLNLGSNSLTVGAINVSGTVTGSGTPAFTGMGAWSGTTGMFSGRISSNQDILLSTAAPIYWGTGTESIQGVNAGNIIRIAVNSATLANFSPAGLAVIGTIGASNKIYPGTDAAAAQSAAGIYAGTGAPSNANGSNGDYYLRSDGGAVTHIYFRAAGSWAGII